MRFLIIFPFILALPSFADSSNLKEMFRTMDNLNSSAVVCAPDAPPELDEESKRLAEKKWYAGAPDCSKPEAKTPLYEVHEVNAGYYVMRQNKCVNFEAPFLYLYIGEDSAFLLDTGATGDGSVRQWVDEVLKNHPKGTDLKLIVAHSHSHGDHMAGDKEFVGRSNTTIIGREAAQIAYAFGINNWPDGTGTIDLGGRKLSVIPIPGHESGSIAIYDHQSRDLLTGDSLYPGNVFLNSTTWHQHKASMARLHAFSQENPVRNILGAHVEMSDTPGVSYDYPETYQPNEHQLPLYQRNLDEIHEHLQQQKTPVRKVFDSVILSL